jgi:hypothetical protein
MRLHRSILHIILRVANRWSIIDHAVRPACRCTIAFLLFTALSSLFLVKYPRYVCASLENLIVLAFASRRSRFCKTKSHVTAHESPWFMIYPSVTYSMLPLTPQNGSIALSHQRCIITAELGRTFKRTFMSMLVMRRHSGKSC